MSNLGATTSNNITAGVPVASQPLVDSSGRPTAQFYRFLVALWTRTGAAPGTNTTTLIENITELATELEANADDITLALLLGGQAQGRVGNSELVGVSGPMLLAAASMLALVPKPKLSAQSVSVPLVTSEVLARGAFVNVWNNGGIATLRNATNTDPTKTANGFVLSSAAIGGIVDFFPPGQFNTGLTGLTPGTLYFLGTAGGVTVTPPAPTATGQVSQMLGKSTSATTISVGQLTWTEL